jgi:hypothetical protein
VRFVAKERPVDTIAGTRKLAKETVIVLNGSGLSIGKQCRFEEQC